MKHRPAKKGVPQITTFMAVLLLLFIVFVSVGYFFTIPEPGADPRRAAMRGQLDRSRSLWDARRPAAFRYDVARHCFCTAEYRRPYSVTESAGSPVFAFASPLAPGGDPNDGAPPEPLGIAGLFGLIDDSLSSAAAVDVAFDPGYGFPTRIVLDRTDAADDELRIEVYDFEVIEYGR